MEEAEDQRYGASGVSLPNELCRRLNIDEVCCACCGCAVCVSCWVACRASARSRSLTRAVRCQRGLGWQILHIAECFFCVRCLSLTPLSLPSRTHTLHAGTLQ